MVVEDKGKQASSSSSLYCSSKCFQMTPLWSSSKPSSSPDQKEQEQRHGHGKVLSDDSKTIQRKHGRWKAVSFILVNETFERLAFFGLLANFMVYLNRVFHMDQVFASNIIYMWSGVSNFAPLLGAFISDTYTGRFRTIAFASFASLLGLVTMTLTAWMRQLHPPPCTEHQKQLGQCLGPSKAQLGVLIMGLGFLSIGSGGVRPCSIPFGVDQFDPTTDEGKKGINSFFNWYYISFTLILLFTQTVVVYIQNSVSWVLGLGIPTVCMFCSIIVFFIGTKIYVHVKPEGSIFSGIVQVFVAAYKKRRIKLPAADGEDVDGLFYDPPLMETVLTRLPFTNQFRFLNKAAVIVGDDQLKPDGTCVNPWRLCSIQQVEEVKCLIRIIPIWSAGIISLTSMTQQGTFTISQAIKMDKHLGPNFEIPPSSLSVISLITVALWLPFYDRVLVPAVRKITKQEGGITILQRIGIGMIFSILSMVVAGLIERARRGWAVLHPGAAPMSAMWLAPQLALMGLCEAFNIIGQIEFFNRQFPEHMRSIANSLFSVSFAGASYFSSILVTIVHHSTGTNDSPDWLTNDINAGKLDYFYFLLAGFGVLNLAYFLYCAHCYRYKGGSVEIIEDKPYVDVELSSIKA